MYQNPDPFIQDPLSYRDWLIIANALEEYYLGELQPIPEHGTDLHVQHLVDFANARAERRKLEYKESETLDALGYWR